MKMLEMKLTITAPELSEAINNLAAAINKGAPNTVCHQHGENSSQIENKGTLNIDMGNNKPINNVQTATPAANPTAPASAPQTATAVPNTPPVNYPTDPNTATPPTAAAPAVPTAPPQYTCDMIAKAGATLVEACKMNELLGLLARFGVEAVTSLDPAQYGAFATELRAMGASI